MTCTKCGRLRCALYHDNGYVGKHSLPILVFHVSWLTAGCLLFLWGNVVVSLYPICWLKNIENARGCFKTFQDLSLIGIHRSCALSRLLMTVQVMIAFFLNESLEVYFSDPSKPATWNDLEWAQYLSIPWCKTGFPSPKRYGTEGKRCIQ